MFIFGRLSQFGSFIGLLNAWNHEYLINVIPKQMPLLITACGEDGVII